MPEYEEFENCKRKREVVKVVVQSILTFQWENFSILLLANPFLLWLTGCATQA